MSEIVYKTLGKGPWRGLCRTAGTDLLQPPQIAEALLLKLLAFIAASGNLEGSSMT